MGEDNSEIQEGIITEIDEETTEPPMYKVLIHNDDYTTKEFVVQILMAVFNKSVEEAAQIMWKAHKTGVGLCGIFPYELAETKVKIVTATAREHGFPLKTTMEEE
ncbi:MAG: ATP-dependent Clp protease adaptor ClpS [Deltaproteobacteria bacterium]|jgi:ATP-dependent Clp protease adaptor protein ClpS|nr:MAG: ATP-dependent Clp protease adaptor ClpS [Deltaproteobacteria bacterium]